jgi:UDP-2,3-diacylglucosamine hydrolase
MIRRTYFVSDIHLRDMQERNGQNLLRFLRFLNMFDEPVNLYFLGDIFDLWISDHQVFVKKFEPLWEPLRQLKAKGCELHFFEGNHDLHIRPFFHGQLGMHVFKKPKYHHVGQLHVRIEHGDLINPNDTAYLKWKAFTQRRSTEFLAHHLPGFFWSWLGNTLSSKSRERSSQYRVNNESEIQKMIHEHAIRSYKNKPFDLIITGHMHVKVDETIEIDGRIIRNINLGTWMGEHEPPILCIEGSEVTWVSDIKN